MRACVRRVQREGETEGERERENIAFFGMFANNGDGIYLYAEKFTYESLIKVLVTTISLLRLW